MGFAQVTSTGRTPSSRILTNVIQAAIAEVALIGVVSRGVGADGHAAAVTTDPSPVSVPASSSLIAPSHGPRADTPVDRERRSVYARRRDGIAPGSVFEFATSFCRPYFSNLTNSRASTEESIRPTLI
jgi:hypothetical protein